MNAFLLGKCMSSVKDYGAIRLTTPAEMVGKNDRAVKKSKIWIMHSCP